MRSTLTVFTSAIEESIKGYASRKLWCGWATIKGGGRPTWRLPHARMLLVPISFFPLLGRLCSGRFYIFTEQNNVILAACFTLRGHGTHTVSIYCGFYFWSEGFALWRKSIFLDLFWSVKLLLWLNNGSYFLRRAFWIWITKRFSLVHECCFSAMLYLSGPSLLVFSAGC